MRAGQTVGALCAAAMLITSSVTLGIESGSDITDDIGAVAPVPTAPTDEISLGSVQKFSTLVVTGSGEPSGLSAEDLKEIRNLARDSGQSESYLLEREGGWDAFDKFTNAIKKSNPETFVEAGFDMTDPRTVWLRTTEKPSEQLLRSASELPFTVRFEWGSRYTDQQLAAIAARVGSLIASVGVDYLRVAPDPATNQIIVDANFKGNNSIQLGLAADVVRDAFSADDLPAAQINSDPDLILSNDVTVAGGLKLNYLDGSGGYCTAGFGVKKGSTRGLATAAHCRNGLAYNGDTDIIQFVEDQATWNGGMVDLQWHRTINGHTASSTFVSDRRNGANIPNTVDYGSNADIGARVCHFGQTTGYQRCSTVSARNVCLFFTDSGYYCGMTETAANVSLGGDSGGPWFTNRVARGIHKGSSEDHSYYTPQTQLGEAYGLSLITS